MANNYNEGTGVLVLERVTPVIKALFGAFALNEGHPGNGQACRHTPDRPDTHGHDRAPWNRPLPWASRVPGATRASPSSSC